MPGLVGGYGNYLLPVHCGAPDYNHLQSGKYKINYMLYTNTQTFISSDLNKEKCIGNNKFKSYLNIFILLNNRGWTRTNTSGHEPSELL